MNSKILNIVAIERQRYVDFFIRETNSLKKEKSTCAIELPIQVNDKTIPYPFNIVYLDFIYKDEENNDRILELRLDKNLDYQFENAYAGTFESQTKSILLEQL